MIPLDFESMVKPTKPRRRNNLELWNPPKFFGILFDLWWTDFYAEKLPWHQMYAVVQPANNDANVVNA